MIFENAEPMEKCKICNATSLDYTKQLSKKEFKALDDTSSLVHLAKGETVFLEEEKLQNLFCIQKGICKFSKLDEKGKEHISRLLGEGEIMGKRSVISNSGAFVSAKAITNTVICKVDKKPFLKSLNENSGFCFDVLKGFITDSKENEKALRFLNNQKSIASKLAGLLCYLVDKFGQEKDGSLVAKLKREDMASIVGTSSEYVITQLQNFKKLNYLEIDKRNIIIHSTERLRSFANN